MHVVEKGAKALFLLSNYIDLLYDPPNFILEFELKSGGGMMNCSWVDLPEDDYSQILGYCSEQTQKLNQFVAAYFDLEQHDEDSLPIRVERLEDIIDFLSEWLEHKQTPQDKPKHLRILKDTAVNKRNYLLELVKISQLVNETEQYLTEYHIPQTKHPLEIVHLNKRRLYSVKKREYWGDFWWVTLDPCHRQLTNYLMVWEKQYQKETSQPIDFFLWLETQNVASNCHREQYFSAEQLSACHIQLKNGLLHGGKNKDSLAEFNDEARKYLYVLGLDEALYITEEKEDIFHSSFYSGKPVLSAGKIKVSQGKIKSVSFESGHYIPSLKVGYQLFEVLLKQGLGLDNHVEVSYFYDRNKYTALMRLNDLSSFAAFMGAIESNQQQKCNQ